MHETIVILDFGSPDHPTHRAARARGRASTARSTPARSARRGRRAAARRASSSPAARCSVYDDGAPAARPGAPRRSTHERRRLRAGPRDLLRAAGDRARRSAAASSARAAASSAARISSWTKRPTSSRGIPDGATVWMSHGDHLTRLPDGFRTIAHDRQRADRRRRRRPTGRIYGVQFHPEVVHTEHGAQADRELRATASAAAGATGRRPRSSRRRSARSARQVGDDHVILGLSRRRRLVGGGGAPARGHRRPADVHLRRQRAAARRASRSRSSRPSATHFHIDLIAVDATDLFLDAPRRRRGPGAEAEDHRPDVHRGVRGRDRSRHRAARARSRSSSRRARSTRT